jgi:hypothetical protein
MLSEKLSEEYRQYTYDLFFDMTKRIEIVARGRQVHFFFFFLSIFLFKNLK